ncbi:MAG TPA: hypothetical protein DEF51_13310 [Myxococcales bacterium]|nr:hypothetical protein [Myxococcales bacterium]
MSQSSLLPLPQISAMPHTSGSGAQPPSTPESSPESVAASGPASSDASGPASIAASGPSPPSPRRIGSSSSVEVRAPQPTRTERRASERRRREVVRCTARRT